MKGFDRLAGTMDVTEQFAVDEKAPTALTLRVETRYSDSLADWMRSRVATRGMPNVARGNLAFYQKRFDGLTESKPLAELGRASCRERVCQYVSIWVVAVSLNNKK